MTTFIDAYEDIEVVIMDITNACIQTNNPIKEGDHVETTVNLTASPVPRLSNLKLFSSCVQFDFTNI